MRPILAGAAVLLLFESGRSQDVGPYETAVEDSVGLLLEQTPSEDLEPDPPDADSRWTAVDWTLSLRTRTERSAGYSADDSTRFLGSPVAVRSRLIVRIGEHIRFSVVADQDAGEPWRSPPNSFDLTRGAFEIKQIGPVEHLVVGSLRPRIGLGLVFWSGQRMGNLMSWAAGGGRANSSVAADRSASETRDVQGVAVQTGLGTRLHVVVFGGRTLEDARLDESGAVSSRPVTGLHRSAREIESRYRLRGRVAGAALHYESKGVSGGFGAFGGTLDHPIPPGTDPYKRHALHGSEWRNAAAYADARLNPSLHLAGETAIDDDRTFAGLVGLRFDLDRLVRASIVWRDYPSRFNAPFGAMPAGSGSGSNNERGWLAAIEVRSEAMRVRVARDLYRRPWLQFSSTRPSVVSSLAIEANGEFEELTLAVRFDRRRSNLPGPAVGGPPFERRSRFRVRFGGAASGPFQPSLDVVFVRLEEGAEESGEAIAQRIKWTPRDGVRLNVGVAFFRTDSGKSGIYLYEPDLPDSFSIPLLTGSGQRVHGVLAVDPAANLSLWVKAAITRYESERTVGSGADRLTGRQFGLFAIAVRMVL